MHEEHRRHSGGEERREHGGAGKEHNCGKHRPEDFFAKDRLKKLEIDNQLVIRLRNLGHVVRILREGKGSQRQVLLILQSCGEITQRELTERMGVRPGSASEVIGKLENAGLIQRKSSEADRRTADIQLTGAGLAQAEEALQQRKQRHREMLSCLTEEEKHTLLALLEKLDTDWEERYLKKEENSKRHREGCGPEKCRGQQDGPDA